MKGKRKKPLDWKNDDVEYVGCIITRGILDDANGRDL